MRWRERADGALESLQNACDAFAAHLRDSSSTPFEVRRRSHHQCARERTHIPTNYEKQCKRVLWVKGEPLEGAVEHRRAHRLASPMPAVFATAVRCDSGAPARHLKILMIHAKFNLKWRRTGGWRGEASHGAQPLGGRLRRQQHQSAGRVNESTPETLTLAQACLKGSAVCEGGRIPRVSPSRRDKGTAQGSSGRWVCTRWMKKS